MFGWFKKEVKQPTLEQNIAKSFFVEGRWVQENSTGWIDTVTGAVLIDGTRGIWIDGVQQGELVEQAFTKMLMLPLLKKIADQKVALERLYANNS